VIEHDAHKLAQLNWDKSPDGLLPAIVQHATSGAVLMLGYMNREALTATLERARAVFFSRSRGRLWEKGETSGHTLHVRGVQVDCDADTLLLSAIPAGPVCHTGSASCFGDAPQSDAERLSFLASLQHVIDQRIAESATSDAPPASYTARLYASGLRRMAQKVGEEGLEVALAAVGDSDAQLIAESADLLFHLLVLLRGRSLGLEPVIAELQRRHAARTQGR
jgi:phosphoribosyl-ATP pyrophosphohydrolase/phosphoribosyl-AMP cyclohydrolase